MMNKMAILIILVSMMFFSLASMAVGAEGRGGVLGSKRRALVPIAAFTATGDLEGLKTSLSEGLEAGLTVNEIKEVLVQMYAYCGFPRSLNAINTFMDLTEERAARGISDEMGPEAGPLPTAKSRERYGHEVRSTLVGGEFPPSGYALFVPVIDTFLKEHLFADIFLRDNLDYRSREIATVSALAALDVPAQLRSHLNICLNIGMSPEELEDLVSVLRDKVSSDQAERAAAVLRQVVESRADR